MTRSKCLTDIEVKVKGKRAVGRILRGIVEGRNVVRDGYYIVNHIGATTYIAIHLLTKEELNEIINILHPNI